jgi:2Fe-2S ferredoxin
VLDRIGSKKMPQIIILPHEELCPEGAVIEAEKGVSICKAMLANDN